MPTGSPPPSARPVEGEQSDTGGGGVAVAGVVLAGGSSRRMGTDKALLVVDGETLLNRAVRSLEQAGASVVVVACGTPDRYAGQTDRPQVPDLPHHRGDGPLAGLAAAFAHLAPTHRVALVLAVDLPDADPALLASLAAGLSARSRRDDGVSAPLSVVPLDETGRAQPLHAAYDIRRALPVLTEALDRGERRVLKVVLDDLHALTVQGPTGAWSRNLNTPPTDDQGTDPTPGGLGKIRER